MTQNNIITFQSFAEWMIQYIIIHFSEYQADVFETHLICIGSKKSVPHPLYMSCATNWKLPPIEKSFLHICTYGVFEPCTNLNLNLKEVDWTDLEISVARCSSQCTPSSCSLTMKLNVCTVSPEMSAVSRSCKWYQLSFSQYRDLYNKCSLMLLLLLKSVKGCFACMMYTPVTLDGKKKY